LRGFSVYDIIVDSARLALPALSLLSILFLSFRSELLPQLFPVYPAIAILCYFCSVSSAVNKAGLRKEADFQHGNAGKEKYR